MKRDDKEFSEFNGRVKMVLNEHVPIKKKYTRANEGPFMTKALRKTIYTRTNLCNRYSKSRSQENWNAFKKQRNKCVKILWQAKFDYYKTLISNVSRIIENSGKQSTRFSLKKYRPLLR